MSTVYRNNHYVPVWYQKRFLPKDMKDQELFYLDLKPDTFTDRRGISHTKRRIRKLGFKYCFSKRNLYTTTFGSEESVMIEQLFFGKIDKHGKHGIEYFTNFEHPSADSRAFHNLIFFLSTQKLRTPKGLGWLNNIIPNPNRDKILMAMVNLRNLFCAIWTECIWLIADASNSNTKFIISDHPVTVYNKRCGPRSSWCRDYKDPDILMHGTHTIFPLSMEKVLILTNLSWIRNPYQNPIDLRPNPSLFRDAIFNFTEVQNARHLNDQEVIQLNFIIKSRALRFIAAAKEEWLFPDKYISKSDWNVYGDGYLCMPDPRSIQLGGEILMGFKDGHVEASDEYGRRPWEKDYNKEGKSLIESRTLDKFKSEFARLYGPVRRGLSYLDNEKDTEELHQFYLELGKKKRKK